MKHFTKFYYFSSLLICLLFAAQSSYADGSKDLYPGGNGGRAKLRSSTASSASYPFASLNTHYVYVKAGETITMASSVMGLGNARIKLTKPDGTTTSYSGATGFISNRINELAGPRLPGVSGGNYYDAILYPVPVGGDGIYSVDFVPPAGETGTNTNGRENSGVLATANWKAAASTDVVIAAWDVSVYGSNNTLIPGRVYSNVLNLDIYSDFTAPMTYYGKMYVLTKDGYIYKVDNNGNNGISFEFFVNSNGFVNTDGEPIYKSLNTTTGISSQIKDPRTADNTTSVTHKMFYTLPASDLPQSASGAVPGGTGTTWLKNPRLVPKVSDLKLFGVEGTEGQVSNKGGNIKFSANLSGRFIIEISPVAPANFPKRTITGFASVGTNSIKWDGKDGLGNPLPSGSSPAKLTVKLQGAEVHFPYFDMEINPNGIKLELLNVGLDAVESDIVYWDDTDITLTSGANNSPSSPINASQTAIPGGTSSNINGHKWGNNTSPTSGTFGDNRSMDTWTFVLGAEETLSTVISTKVADLKVNSITPSASTVGANGNITYTVEVQNSDGSAAYSDVTNAPFSFNVPAGMEIVSATYVSDCGTESSGAISADKLHYNSALNLTNGCKGTYTIVTKAVSVASGKITVEATIMRPNDVNDPDATNPDPNVVPTDPHLECKNGTATESCNNIKYNNVVTLINKITAVKSIVGNPVTVKPGDVLTYNIILTNTDALPKTGVTASDVVPSTLIAISAIDNGGIATGNTINWTNLTVPASGTLTLSFKATVAASLPAGTTSIKNTASVVDPIDPTTPITPVVEKPTEGKITAVKSIAGDPTTVKPGDVLTYTITLTNSFGTAKTGVTASDNVPSTLTGITAIDNGGIATGNTINWANLTVPASGTLTLSFKATVAASLPAGTTSIKNTASVVDPIDPTTPITPVVEKPTEGKITAVKSIAGDPVTVKPGDVLTYNIVLTNSFGTAKTGVTASDAVPSTLTNITAIDNGGIATGNTINWTNLTVPANGTLTLSFKATVAASLPTGTTSIKNTASIVDPIDPTTPLTPVVEKPTEGKITAVKSIAGDPVTVKPGDVLTYNIVLTNSFGTAKTGVTASDAVPSTLTNITAIDNGGIATGNTINWTNLTVPANGTLTLSFKATVAASLPAGTTSIKNTASIVDPIDPTTPITPVVEKPTEGKITTVKSIAGDPTTVKPGDVLTYNIVLTNSFGTAKTGVTASDAVPSTLTNITAIDNGGIATGNTINWTNLTVPASGTLTLSFKATVAANLPVGTTSIKNTASIVDPIDPTTPITPVVEKPTEGKITAVKSIAGDPVTVKPGDVLTYTINLTNSFGTAKTGVTASDAVPSTLTNITAIDNGGIATGNTINWTNLTVPANGTLTLSFKATVAANLPVGTTSIKNTASVVDPIDPTTPLTPVVEKPIVQNPKIVLVKVVTNTGSGTAGAYQLGDQIEYTFKVTNTGDVVLRDIVLNDPLIANTNINIPGELLVAATVNYVARYTITQNDVDAGKITNSATVEATAPDGTKSKDVSGSQIDNDDPTVTVILQKAGMTLVKTGTYTDTNNDGKVNAGDKIIYAFTVSNVGNVTIKNIMITDSKVTVAGGPLTLGPGAIDKGTFTAVYTITQADVDAGRVDNMATVTGKGPNGDPVTATSTSGNPADPATPIDPKCKDCTITPLPASPSLNLTKTAVAGTVNKVGDVITYNLVLKNTGNVSLTGIQITDANADGGSIIPANISNLAPGATVNMVAKHTVTQADLDKGYVSNLAKADGKDPKGGNVHGESTDPSPIPGAPKDPDCPTCTITPVQQKGSIALVKKVTNTGTGQKGAFVLGNEIEYTFTITNTGNISLKNVVLNDPLLNKPAISIPGIITPGESLSHKEKYVITSADIAKGNVTNQAVVNASDPKGTPVTDQSGTAANNDDPTVTTLAKPPVATDDKGNTLQNQEVVISVLDNDTPGDSDLDASGITITQQPAHGKVVVNPNGTITYKPDPGYTGEDKFTYTVKDKNGQVSNVATGKITVTPTKPIAQDDEGKTTFNKPIDIKVLDNDKENGAPLDKGSIQITGQPKHGTVTIGPDGTVTYKPNSGYTGADEFTYTVKDVNGNITNMATVKITIEGFFIPNVITPNGDGKNDAFVIVGKENYDVVEIEIYNRWGSQVYRHLNYQNNWTGEGLNEGTYYYIIRLKKASNIETVKGWVLIKR